MSECVCVCVERTHKFKQFSTDDLESWLPLYEGESSFTCMYNDYLIWLKYFHRVPRSGQSQKKKVQPFDLRVIEKKEDFEFSYLKMYWAKYYIRTFSTCLIDIFVVIISEKIFYFNDIYKLA